MSGRQVGNLIGVLCLLMALVLYVRDADIQRPRPRPIPDVVVEPPMPGLNFGVLIVESRNERARLSRGQLETLQSAEFRRWLANNGAEHRIWDENTDISRESEPWQKGMRRPRDSLPWLIVSNERTGFTGPLPPTLEETIALLERFKP